MSEELVLQCRDITKEFESESTEGKLQIVQGVNLDLPKAELVSILGSSGSGKSTLVHSLGGLASATSGEVLWNGASIYSHSPDKIAELRNKEVGFVFQFHHLLPEFRSEEHT